MTYRWLRVPMLGAAALAMMLATTGPAQASPREGGDYGRYETAYGYGDGYYAHRVVYRRGHRVIVRVYVHPRRHRYYRYDRDRYYRHHRYYHRYQERW